MSNEVTARRVADYDACEHPGDFFLTTPDAEGVRRLSFLCPCGCCSLCGIRIKTGEKTAAAWQWDGNEDKPTTTPSININRGHWHGYLTSGVFRSC